MEPNKASSFFRKRLKQSIPLWQERGFLTEQQGQQLGQFYQLDQIKTENTQLLLSVIYTIGSILIGVGVISFVAAHWNQIDRPVKVALIFTAMLTAHGLGYYFWFINGNYPKLGHALVLLGTLIFGANIGLMAQIFHISGGAGRMFGVWAIGAAAVAYAVRSIPNATVAVVMSFLFFMGYSGISWWGANNQLFWYPMAVIVVLLPLVYLCNSRWLLWLLMVNLALTSIFAFGEYAEYFGVYVIAIALGAGILGLGIVNQCSQSFRHFSRHCMNAGAALILLFVFLTSFGEMAEEFQEEIRYISGQESLLITISECIYVVLCYLIYGFSISLNFKKIQDPLTVLLLGIGGICLAFVGLMSSIVTWILANVLLIAIAVSMIRASFSEEDRRKFWCGAVILGAVVIGRTLELETGLLIKAIAFTASGVGVIVGGVFFEKFMKKRKVLHA